MREHRNPDRLKRSRIFYWSMFLFVGSITMILLIALQSLILPVLIGAISAYIAMPLLNVLMKRGIPKAGAILILFGVFVFLVTVIGEQIVSVMPDEKEKLELRVNVQYKLNEIYLDVLGKESFSDEGNMVSTLFGDEIRPVIESVNTFMNLDQQEDSLFQSYASHGGFNDQTLKFYNENKNLPMAVIDGHTGPESADSEDDDSIVKQFKFTPENSKIASLLSAISNWLVTPFVFVFLLLDDGQIKRFMIKLVPNRYFEMALTTVDNVDQAIGQYLRGTLLECSLVGLSFLIGLLLVGFDLQAALLIGIVAGIANAIPFLGPVIGLLVGVAYALIIENIDPLIPFVGGDSAILLVVLVVIIVQLLDNAVYNPVVLGKAVNLHPLIVIIGVAGGSIMFGFTGMLFAIPTIVIVNEIISTLYKQLKAYFIIY